MKKFFMFALAAVAMLSVTSCMNEKDMDLAPNQGKTESEAYGYISLNATTQNAVITRSVTTENGVTKLDGDDTYTWWAKVKDKDNKYQWGTSTSFNQITSALATTPIVPGTCTVEVCNYASLNDALNATPVANDDTKYGAAYWVGSGTGTVIARQSTEIIANCERPQNAKLTVSMGTFNGTNLVVHLKDATFNRDINFSYDATNSIFNNDGVAYFASTEAVQFYITYSFGGVDNKRWPAETDTPNYSTIAMGGRGKSSSLIISSNTSGSITIKITTQDFEEPTATTTQTIEFDAVTGEKTQSN